ncbi:hypothetical protein GH714_011423 [Hevea brasiliensis]|uniref:Leucine-rich repeat-containing N-terminal plant-type domain-containing protein n=1 Tax=Hevea brasiliensis TaxID=3981 RepID=A0A6A6MZI4_HEVBR|nr:hypothetical protein GH714_011423 [Hevea brasiliensis]
MNLSSVAPSSFMNLPSSLHTFRLEYCGLQVNFIDYIHSSTLISLDLSFNYDLVLDTIMFNKLVQNLPSLIEVDLRFVNMSLVEPISLMNLSSSLSSLQLLNCGLRGEFPGNLLQRPNLRVLDLWGNYDLIGCLPRSNWSCSLERLSLSYTKIAIHLEGDLINNLSGQIPLEFGNLEHLTSLDLSFNNFSGQIPLAFGNLEHLRVLDLSFNNFSGQIPFSLANLKQLFYLDLDNNNLSGAIPNSFANLAQLRYLMLSNNRGMNNFQGSIPASFSKGNSLRYLNFNGNQLGGQIPPSIANCKNLEVLDIGNNKIDDTFPVFLETLTQLQVLVLRSNKLHGFLKGATANYSFSKLRIVDMSSNSLSGTLPLDYFSSLEAMIAPDQNIGYMGANTRTNTYRYSVHMTWKGWGIELIKIQTVLTIIDFSANKFTGNIPWSIGKLKSLIQLNLSHNYLTGNIPHLLGKLKNLESLDLSSNMLTGKIPTQLVNLIFLSVFRVSHNQLEGRIPLGKQLDTLIVVHMKETQDCVDFP